MTVVSSDRCSAIARQGRTTMTAIENGPTPLEKLRIAQPCPARWEAMAGMTASGFARPVGRTSTTFQPSSARRRKRSSRVMRGRCARPSSSGPTAPSSPPIVRSAAGEQKPGFYAVSQRPPRRSSVSLEDNSLQHGPSPRTWPWRWSKALVGIRRGFILGQCVL
jgi:hypothetical protein